MVLDAFIIMFLLALVLGLALGYASLKLKVDADPIVEQIDAILPQIQCGQCGFPGCRPYAEAIATEKAEINRCVPGGGDVIQKLAELLDKPVISLAIDTPAVPPVKGFAFIDEACCIGCTRCIQVCPVDAIVGAARCMHTVIRRDCTGCGLCISTCPADCIRMEPLHDTIDSWRWQKPENRPVTFIEKDRRT